MLREALALDSEHGDLFSISVDRHSLALASLCAGRPGEARELLSGIFGHVASSGNTSLLVNTLEVAAGIMAGLNDPRAARPAGAADAIRQESGMLLTEPKAAMLEASIAPARATVSPQAWNAELAAGRALSQPEALSLLLTACRIACYPCMHGWPALMLVAKRAYSARGAPAAWVCCAAAG